jgi:phosphohistidine phosphatase
MKLYLVQHAKAASEQVDPQRPLTEEGYSEIQKVAAFIKPLNLCVDHLWHSGKKRAAQTAEVLAEVIRISKTQTAHEGLGPTDDVTALKDELVSATEDIMVVGHLPFLSKLTSLLLAGSESANMVAFKNGGIVCLERSEKNQWQIDCVITPELIA